jgi:putative Mg2+ transporter-C (MgtC) family protein
MTMPLHPTWQDIAIRLALTMVAGALVGLNRESRGHAAGFRTTILVSLAACVTMIQANILLSVGGKAADSFGVMDVLRFPLGVLTGVGFIGGGAILKRGDLVTGVTTAATLWAMTAIGLCFGGGQLGVGCAATVLALFTLWALKYLDMRLPRGQRAIVVLEETGNSGLADLDALLRPLRCKAAFLCKRRDSESGRPVLSYEVHWTRSETEGPPADVVSTIEDKYSLVSFEIKSGPGQ